MIRPRLVWGPGDTTVLPGLLEAVRSGQFAWIGGGRHRTSTTHVDNVVEGLLLGAREGRPGEAYFVTDGEPLVFRDFVTRLLATAGEDPGERPGAPLRGRGAAARRRGALARAAAARLAAADPRWPLAHLAGVHDRHHEGARRSWATAR